MASERGAGPVVTEAELLEEIRRWSAAVPDREPGVLTGPEMAEALGLSYRTVITNRIPRWLKEGRLKPVRLTKPDLLGRMVPTWGYRLVEPVER
jgi:hypothetical protein